MRGMRMVLARFLVASLILLLGPVHVAQGDAQVIPPGPHGWQRVAAPGFGDPTNTSVAALAVYNNRLYAGTINRTNGGSVWRYVSGTKWEVVAAPGLISTKANPAITGMIVFKNRLYIGTAWSALAQDSWLYKVWRYDGVKWEEVLRAGKPVHGFTTFGVYNNELYVGVSTKNDIFPAQGARILRSPSGDLGSWQPSVTNGNGNPSGFGVTSLKVFNNRLYAAVADQSRGLQVWEYNGSAWSTVVNNGFGLNGALEPDNWDPGGFAVFGSALFLGLRNQDFSQTTSTGGKVYYTLDGKTWKPAVKNGFGNLDNIKVEGLTIHERVAYALTYNAKTGMEVWSSTTGTLWKLDRAGGFGDAANHNSLWTSAQVVYNGSLYVGTSNYNSQAGGQVWKMVSNAIYLPLIDH